MLLLALSMAGDELPVQFCPTADPPLPPLAPLIDRRNEKRRDRRLSPPPAKLSLGDTSRTVA